MEDPAAPPYRQDSHRHTHHQDNRHDQPYSSDTKAQTSPIRSRSQDAVSHSSRVQLDQTQVQSPPAGRTIVTSPPKPYTRKVPAYGAPPQTVTTPVSRQTSVEPETPDLVCMETVAPQTVADDGEHSALMQSRYKEKKLVEPSRSRLAISRVTPRRVAGTFSGTGMSSNTTTTAATASHGSKTISC